MKKIKFIHLLVASATSAMILLCGGVASLSAVAESELYSYELSADGKYYTLVVNDKTLADYQDIPSEYNGLPVDVNNQFFNCVNATSLDIPNVKATPEFISSHNPYNVTAVTSTNSSLKTLKVRYTGNLQLALANAQNLEEVYLYCSSLKVVKIKFRNNSADAVWHVANDDVKATLTGMGVSEEKVTVDLSSGKSDSTLKISASAESMTYGESDITVSVEENTSGVPVAYQFSSNKDFLYVTSDIIVGSDGKIVPKYAGTYYMRAVTPETDDYNSAMSNVVKITVNSVDKSDFTNAYNEAHELWYKTREDYTEESMTALRSVYTKYDEYTKDILHTAAEYEAAENEIREAIGKLVKIDATEAKEALKNAIDKAEALVQTDYSETTWSELSTALEEARTVYANDNAGASSIVAAAEKLTAAIEKLESAPIGLPSFDCAVQFSNTGWWPQYNITETFEGNGTFTIKIDTSAQATTEAFVFNVDLLKAVTSYPNIKAVLDSIKVDGTETAFDASKIQYGDLESNGNYRIEIYNDYGSTKKNPPLDPKSLASSKSIEITFTVSGIPENDPKGELQKLADETEKMLSDLIEGDYTAESIEAVKTAVSEAKALLEKESLLQSEIANAKSAITSAVDSMVIADTTEASAELEKAVESADALNKKDYTDKSWKAVEDALAKAEAITDNSTNSQIKAVTEELNNAIASLVKASADSTSDGSSDTESNSDSDNSSSSKTEDTSSGSSSADSKASSSNTGNTGSSSASSKANDPVANTGMMTGGISVIAIISLAAAAVAKKKK